MTEADLRAIADLKYRYLRLLDTKDWAGFAECLVPEATGDYAGLAFADRDALVAYMRENLPDHVATMHTCHHPELDVDGDTATGRWYLHDKVISAEWNVVLEGAAVYQDRYVRTPQGWRIAHTGYERTFEVTHAADAVPGFTLRLRPRHG